MASLSEIRKKYPQYDDLSDQQLADSFHNKFYSDIPKDEFYKKIGYQSEQKPQPYLNEFATKGLNKLKSTSPGAYNTLANISNFIDKSGISKGAEKVNQAFEMSGLPQAAGGFVQGIDNFIPELSNLGIAGFNKLTGKNIKEVPTYDAGGEGFAKSVGEGLSGVAFPTAPVGEVLGTSKILQGAVPVGQIASDAARGIGNVIGKATLPFRPGKQAENILENLSRGASIDRNKEIIANMIRSKASEKIAESNKKYASALGRASNIEVMDKGGLFVPIKDRHLGFDLKEAISKFNENPTFLNAHKLQSDMQKRVFDLIRQRSITKKDAGKELGEIQKGLVSNIYKTLEKSDPIAAKNYKEATAHYRKEVVPYNKHPVISKLLDPEKEVNINTLPNVFKKEGKSISKIIGDLGKELKNRLIYNQVGKTATSKPGELSEALIKASKEGGVSKYMTKDIMDQQRALNKAILLKKLGLGAAGAAVGGAGLAKYTNLPGIIHGIASSKG